MENNKPAIKEDRTMNKKYIVTLEDNYHVVKTFWIINSSCTQFGMRIGNNAILQAYEYSDDLYDALSLYVSTGVMEEF